MLQNQKKAQNYYYPPSKITNYWEQKHTKQLEWNKDLNQQITKQNKFISAKINSRNYSKSKPKIKGYRIPYA